MSKPAAAIARQANYEHLAIWYDIGVADYEWYRDLQGSFYKVTHASLESQAAEETKTPTLKGHFLLSGLMRRVGSKANPPQGVLTAPTNYALPIWYQQA
jgi:hypothetical protein